MAKYFASTELYESKSKWYSLMIRNLEKQLKCIENNSYEELLQVQNEWEELRLSVDNIDELLSLQEGKGVSPVNSNIVQDLMAKGQRLSELNLLIQRVMEKRLTDVKEELAQVKIGQKVANGYRVNTKSVSAFIDKNI